MEFEDARKDCDHPQCGLKDPCSVTVNFMRAARAGMKKSCIEQARVRRQRHRESKRNAGMVPAEIWLPQAWRDAVIARGKPFKTRRKKLFSC